jgi:hypothetical protein
LLDVEITAFAGGLRLAEIVADADSDGFVNPGPRQGVLVSHATLRSGTASTADVVKTWQATVRSLASLPRFRTASFILVRSLRSRRSSKLLFPRRGRYRLRIGQLYEFMVLGISPDVRSDAHVYRVSFDRELIDVYSGSEFRLGYEFDAITISVAILSTHAPVTRIQILPPEGELGTEVELEIALDSRPLLELLRSTAIGGAAAVAASAGVLPEQVPNWFRFAMVALGSAGLAVASRRWRNRLR